jgi:hypothetical protein
MIDISEDLDFGFASEEEFIVVLKNKHDKCDVSKYSYKWSSFDFKVKHNGTMLKEYELKTRRVNNGVFPTLIFGKTKWDYALKKIKNGIQMEVVWKLNDCVLSWVIDPEKTDEYYIGSGQNVKRGEKPKACIHVRCEFMKKWD